MTGERLHAYRERFEAAGLGAVAIDGEHAFAALCPTCVGQVQVRAADNGTIDIACRNGCDRSRIVDQVHLRAERAQRVGEAPPLPEDPVAGGDNRGGNGGGASGRRVIFTPSSEIEPERLRWLWQHRLVLGALSLIAGEPGLGKSALTVELSARVTPRGARRRTRRRSP